MNHPTRKTISILSYMLFIILAFVSVCGAFIPGTYSLETASLAAQGIGQDLVNLFLVAPALLVTLPGTKKGNIKTTLIFEGIVFYIIYSFIIYSLGIHFNYLFLAYCAVLGISVFLFIIVFREVSGTDIRNEFNEFRYSGAVTWFLLIVSVIFALLWLKDIIPAIAGGYAPKSVSDYNLLVNPVHVIDLSFALPGLVIAAILLHKKQNMGYMLAPIALVFMVFMALALAAMVILTRIKGISEDPSVAVIFVVLTLISLVLLYFMLKKSRKA